MRFSADVSCDLGRSRASLNHGMKKYILGSSLCSIASVSMLRVICKIQREHATT